MGDEALRYPEKATVLGPVGVMPQELPALTLQSIDLAAPIPAGRLRKRATVRMPRKESVGLFRAVRNGACLALFVLRFPPGIIGRLAA